MKFNTLSGNSLVYGTITGIIIVLYLFMVYILGRAGNSNITSLSTFLFISGAFISVKYYRDNMQKGVLNFGSAFKAAFLTCLFAGFIWFLYAWVLFRYISPELFLQKLDEAKESMSRSGLFSNLEETFTRQTPFTYAFGYLFSSAFWGAILSLLIAAILRRNEANPKKEVEN